MGLYNAVRYKVYDKGQEVWRGSEEILTWKVLGTWNVLLEALAKAETSQHLRGIWTSI